MTGRAAALALVAALLLSGCSVARLPETAATRDQTETQHRLDVADCKAEVGYRHNYNGDDSPLANALRNVFVLGTSGAALGGVVTGLPASTASTATEGLIAGAGAGGIAGGVISVPGRSRFEREWIACMESRGYRIVATPRAIH
jgi:type IV pilus biogenesis protein CpaD/CtpE